MTTAELREQLEDPRRTLAMIYRVAREAIDYAEQLERDRDEAVRLLRAAQNGRRFADAHNYLARIEEEKHG